MVPCKHPGRCSWLLLLVGSQWVFLPRVPRFYDTFPAKCRLSSASVKSGALSAVHPFSYFFRLSAPADQPTNAIKSLGFWGL